MKTSKDKKADKRDDLASMGNVKTIASIIAFCVLCSLTLFALSGQFVNNEAGREKDALILAQQIVDKDIKILSPTLSSIKQKMLQLVQKLEATDPAVESRTNVKHFKPALPRQDDLSENEAPKGLLPP
jgi:hypothetical protein